MTKAEELANPNSTLNKAQDDEPIFVLVAHDATAWATVLDWVLRARRAGAPAAKLKSADAIAFEMMEWAIKHNGPKVPD